MSDNLLKLQARRRAVVYQEFRGWLVVVEDGTGRWVETHWWRYMTEQEAIERAAELNERFS